MLKVTVSITNPGTYKTQYDDHTFHGAYDYLGCEQAFKELHEMLRGAFNSTGCIRFESDNQVLYVPVDYITKQGFMIEYEPTKIRQDVAHEGPTSLENVKGLNAENCRLASENEHLREELAASRRNNATLVDKNLDLTARLELARKLDLKRIEEITKLEKEMCAQMSAAFGV